MAEHREVFPSEHAACDLRELAIGSRDECDGTDCVYWRVLEHVGESDVEKTGCAIGHFEILADKNPEVAVWLLSVKRRVDDLEDHRP
jgi:hypothetical protein